VVLLKPGTLPKTSSGKVQRYECRERYQSGTLEPIAQSSLRTAEQTVTTVRPGGDIAAALMATPPEERCLALQAFLQGQVARILKTHTTNIDPQRPLGSLGMDSLMAVELAHRVEK